MKVIYCYIFSITIVSCDWSTPNKEKLFSDLPEVSFPYETIGEIPVPGGYNRVVDETNLFAEWLRTIDLKRDSRIYLFNGRLREEQSTHFAVLDIPVGDKDLQQCADAIMRLRAEYFFGRDEMDSIRFKATDGTDLCFARWMKGERYHLKGKRLVAYQSGFLGGNKRSQLEQFLEVVFSYCGTISLDKETRRINDLNNLQAGDIFVKAGSPGHAMIVVDVAVNNKNEKIFMLAQGFMPAQSVHIVKNLLDETISPWYKVTDGLKIVTPDWDFYPNQLARWQ